MRYGRSKKFNFEWECFELEVQSIILLLERVSNLFVTRWLIYTEQDTLPVTYSWRSRICVCLTRTRYWNLSIVALLWRNDEVDGDRMWKGRNNLSLGDQWVVGLDFHHHHSTNSQEWELLSRIPHFHDEQYFCCEEIFGSGAHCVQGLKYCRHCVINV